MRQVHSNYTGYYGVPTNNFDGLISMFIVNIYGRGRMGDDSTLLVNPEPTPFEMLSIMDFCVLV